MKIMTILGTRPELIRLSLIIAKLDSFCDHVLVHTGQNYDPTLKDVFFEELGIRAPDRSFSATGDFGNQVGVLFTEIESLFKQERPDKVLILGDTNSGLSALVAKRMGIPVYHMEAGNRCYDDRVPEEVNRRVIDHSSDILMPYTEGSRKNLLREGIGSQRVIVTGNPIHEVMEYYRDKAASSSALEVLGVVPGEYILVTMHRAENVDVPGRLQAMVKALDQVAQEFAVPVVVSTHPRTRVRMQEAGLAANGDAVRFMDPFGFGDFLALEGQAKAVLSDSGTVQEECCIMKVPTVTLRDTTERPETIECGSNILSGVEPESVLRALRLALSVNPAWTPPVEYLAPCVSDTVLRIMLGLTGNESR
jgi:UDP-N-acetylglucosamine 2-epimerase (non-hydrolysing)